MMGGVGNFRHLGGKQWSSGNDRWLDTKKFGMVGMELVQGCILS